MRRGATSVMKWFSAIYVVAIVVQVFLAGEGIFRLNNIKHSDDCDKAGAHCVANSKTLDAHRAFGSILVFASILFLIVALVAWHQNKRIRWVSIVTAVLTFLQIVLAAVGGWVGGLHPVNAMLVLGLYGWLFYALRREAPEAVTTPATAPAA
jgi:uncharacterized membrane protein